jgi:sec-independent protein translocase protein TatA
MADGVNMLLGFIGPTEVVVILVIALLVFGPHKLPEIGKQIGSAYRELNKMRNDVQRALDIDVYGNNHYNNNDPYDHSNYGSDAQYGTTYPRTDTPALNGSTEYGYTYGAEETYGDHSMPPGFVAPPGPAAAQAAQLLESGNAPAMTTDASNGLNGNGVASHNDFDSHAAHENDPSPYASNGNGTGSHDSASATVAATTVAASAAYSLQTDQPAEAGPAPKEH